MFLEIDWTEVVCKAMLDLHLTVEFPFLAKLPVIVPLLRNVPGFLLSRLRESLILSALMLVIILESGSFMTGQLAFLGGTNNIIEFLIVIEYAPTRYTLLLAALVFHSAGQLVHRMMPPLAHKILVYIEGCATEEHL